MALDVGNPVAGVELIPAAVEVLGGQPQLNDQDASQVERRLLAALFPPEPQKSLFVLAHDDPGVGAADEFSSANHLG